MDLCSFLFIHSSASILLHLPATHPHLPASFLLLAGPRLLLPGLLPCHLRLLLSSIRLSHSSSNCCKQPQSPRFSFLLPLSHVFLPLSLSLSLSVCLIPFLVLNPFVSPRHSWFGTFLQRPISSPSRNRSLLHSPPRKHVSPPFGLLLFFWFLSRSFSFPFPPGVLPRLNFSCYIGQQAPPTTFFATTTLSTTLVINTLGQVNVVSFSLPFPIHSPFSIPHSPFPTCSCPLQRFQVLTLLLLGSPPPTAPSDRRPFRFPIDSETIHPKAYGRLSPLSARALPRLPSAPPLDLHRRPADPYHNSTSFWHHAFYSARHRSDPETATRFTYFT